MSAAPPRAAAWARNAERGSLPLMRFMAWASLALGRSASRILLRLVTAYFFATAAGARSASRQFLARALGRAPTVADVWRLFFTFSTTIHDRIYFLKDRFDLFSIEVHGAELFDDRGTLLMGAHLGSFEALRACGRHLGQRRVAMAMYEENAARIGAVLAAIAPAARADIVALGRPDSMLELARRLEEGALVGMLADRTLGDEPSIAVDFLGAAAQFPTGPMRLAAALRQRVLFMAGLHRGGNRYEIRFEPIADFSGEDAARGNRDALVREAVVAYARALERLARSAPYNWFNFHDFWSRAG